MKRFLTSKSFLIPFVAVLVLGLMQNLRGAGNPFFPILISSLIAALVAGLVIGGFLYLMFGRGKGPIR